MISWESFYSMNCRAGAAVPEDADKIPAANKIEKPADYSEIRESRRLIWFSCFLDYFMIHLDEYFKKQTLYYLRSFAVP